MINWKQFPFVKMLIPLCLGIWSSFFLFPDFIFPFYFFLIFFVFTISVLALPSRFISYSYRWLSGFVVSVFMIFLGITLVSMLNEMNSDNHFSKMSRNKIFYRIKVIEPIEIKENSVKVISKVIACKPNNKWENCMGSLMCYIEKDSLSEQLNYGDVLLIYAQPNEIQKPRNPHEFNYKRYLSIKNIFFQTYLKSESLRKIASRKGNPLKAFSINLRSKLLKIFEDNGMNGREYAVISAILLGQTDKIDPELYKAYSGSGAVHVLAVSGMHVGIIFVSLSLFLSFFDKIKRGRIVKAIILLIAVWFYAMLTGLSPSVVRASTMISFIIVGKALKRDSNIVNVLSASGFVILCVNPALLLEVGFQLSFLAVLGIVLFYDMIYKLWLPDNKLLDKLWSVSCVSVSAQFVTTPLALYYFHQFPNYFLLTNIVVFIFAGVVIYAGIIVLLVSFIPYVSVFSAKVLVWIIFAMNESIRFIEGLPLAVSRGINFAFADLLLLYILLISLIYAFAGRSKNLLFASLLILLLMVSLGFFNEMTYCKQKRFVVYAINKYSAIDFLYGKKQLLIADNTLLNSGKIEFHIQNNHVLNGIKSKSFVNINSDFAAKEIPFMKQQNFIYFAGKRIAMIDKAQKYMEAVEKIPIDYLILSNNCNVAIAELLKVFKPRLIIFDTSNKLWTTNKWEMECNLVHLPHYNVLEKGAFVADIRD